MRTHYTTQRPISASTQNLNKKQKPLFISIMASILLLIKGINHPDRETGLTMGAIALSLITVVSLALFNQPLKR